MTPSSVTSIAAALPDGWFAGVAARAFDVNGTSVVARYGGTARGPTLLLHGFPETHAVWHRVVQTLAAPSFLVLPDLHSSGDSAKPPGLPDHSTSSKRSMAQHVVGDLDALDRGTLVVCGHDHGGRVAHRLALDCPTRVNKLCGLDIAPTLDRYTATDMAFATAYDHWFHAASEPGGGYHRPRPAGTTRSPLQPDMLGYLDPAGAHRRPDQSDQING